MSAIDIEVESGVKPTTATASQRKEAFRKRRRQKAKKAKQYYCHYCDVYLKGHNPRLRLEHNTSVHHMNNFEAYYQWAKGKDSEGFASCTAAVESSRVSDSQRQLAQCRKATTGTSTGPSVEAVSLNVGVQVAPGIVVGGSAAVRDGQRVRRGLSITVGGVPVAPPRES